MADSLEPTPDGIMSILFENSAKYGTFECELWCKEARAVCEYVIHNINGICGSKANVLYTKFYISFPIITTHEQAEMKRMKSVECRRGLLLFDTVSHALVISLGPGLDLDRYLVFGRIVGKGLYQLHLFDEALDDDQKRPVYDVIINRCLVTECPFEVPLFTAGSILNIVNDPVEEKKEPIVKPKNTKLLSFADDDEDAEDTRVKSCHDVVHDARLSKEAVSVPTVTATAVVHTTVRKEPELVLPTIIEQKIEEPQMIVTNEPIEPKMEQNERIFPHKEIVQEKIKSFLASKPKTVMGKRRLNESDTLSELNSYCAKLRQSPSAVHRLTAIVDDTPCRLHGLVGCESCISTFGIEID